MGVLSLMLAILFQGLVVQAKSNVLPEAVKYAVANSFNNTAQLFHVLIETDYEENTVKFLDIVDNLLVGKDSSFQFEIDVNNKDGGSVCDHNLWFIDSYLAFRRLLPRIRHYHSDSQLFHLIVIKMFNTEGHLDVMQKIFLDFLRMMQANVNILIETASEEVSFYTFYPYQELECRSTKPFLIYKFNQKTLFQFTNVSLFPPKASNFYRCPLRLKTRNPFFHNLQSFEVYYIETVIVNVLASKLNFSYEIVNVSPNENVLLNEHLSGPSELLQNGEIDMVFGLLINDAKINHFLSKSVPYIFSWVVMCFLYRPNVLQTYGWLLISFDSTTWMCILLSLTIIAGCTIYVKKTRRFVNILGLQHVGFLEILAVSIGASIGYLPKKNCLRLVFIVLSLGALVIRTAYLGKLFDAYRGLIITQQPQDFNELLAENYTIYAHSYFASVINELRKLKSIDFEHIPLINRETGIFSHIEKKSAVFTTFLYFYSYSSQEERRDLVVQTIFAEQICMFFYQHSIILPKVNNIIERLEEAGILHHLRKNYENINEFGISPKKNVNGYELLGFERFSLTFYFFIGLNAFACLVLITELLWNKIMKSS